MPPTSDSVPGDPAAEPTSDGQTPPDTSDPPPTDPPTAPPPPPMDTAAVQTVLDSANALLVSSGDLQKAVQLEHDDEAIERQAYSRWMEAQANVRETKTLVGQNLGKLDDDRVKLDDAIKALGAVVPQA